MLDLVAVMDAAEGLSNADLRILAAFVDQVLEERARDERVLANTAKSERRLLAELALLRLPAPPTTVLLD